VNIDEKIHTKRIEFVCEPGIYQSFRHIVKERTGSDRNIAKVLRQLMAGYVAEGYRLKGEEKKND